MLFQTLESETVPRRVKSLLGITYSWLLLCYKQLLDKTLSYTYCLFFHMYFMFVLTGLSNLSMAHHRISPGYVQTEPNILCCKQNKKIDETML